MRKQQDVDESKMIVNPFSYSLKIKITELVETAETFNFGVGDKKVEIVTPVEYDSYTKVFYHNGIRDIIFNLSPQAKSLYLFVLYNLDTGKDYLQMNSQWYMTKNNVSSINTFKGAVKELCRHGFLSLSVDYNDVYWINPQLFFHGNRIKKFPENTTVKSRKKI